MPTRAAAVPPVVIHPISPLLVGAPVGFGAAAVLGFVTYQAGGHALWFKLGFVANLAVIVTVLAALLPGVITWAFGTPPGGRATSSGRFHLLASLPALLLLAISAAMTRDQWDAAHPHGSIALLSSALALALILFATSRATVRT